MAAHLTILEREVQHRLLKQGESISQIAQTMGRDRSTIYREINRNSGQCGYRPKQAQRKADERRLICRRPCKMGGVLRLLNGISLWYV